MKKKEKIEIVLIFLLSQFIFFGWALGKFVEPTIFPLLENKEFIPIDSGDILQPKYGELNIGNNLFFVAKSSGGIIYFNQKRAYLKSIPQEGFIFENMISSGNTTTLKFVFDNTKNMLKLETNKPIALSGLNIKVGNVDYPAKGSLCGYSRVKNFGDHELDPLFPCQGQNIINSCPTGYKFLKFGDPFGGTLYAIITCVYMGNDIYGPWPLPE